MIFIVNFEYRIGNIVLKSKEAIPEVLMQQIEMELMETSTEEECELQRVEDSVGHNCL